MSVALSHRGPDDEHRYVGPHAALGCRRLSIQDVEHGRQPLSNSAGTVWVALNGEIYNCDRIRPGLEAKGHIFRTRNDAEVILRLYEEQGTDCVKSLRGMFAFAIWDEQHQRLLLARDHIGQKPMYFAHLDGAFCFASEPKALTAANPSLQQCDFQSLSHYLSLRFVPAPGTMFRDVKKLPPAHTLVYEDGRARMLRYWSPSFTDKLSLSEAEFIDGLEAKLEETVASHLVGEAPIGAFLSGGLDSSLLVAMMARTAGQRFPTFSVGVQDPRFNELPYARLVSDKYSTLRFETTAEIDLIRSIATMIWHLDEPSDPVAASKFLGSRLASEHVKVVLGGDGGDELFAGFDRYRGVQRAGLYGHIPLIMRKHIIGPVLRAFPASFGYDSLVQKLRWFHQVGCTNDVAHRFAEAVSFFRFNHAEKAQLFTEAIWRELEGLSTSRLIVNTLEGSPASNPIEQMLYTDYVTRLPEHSLMLTDRLGMAHGLEVRSPLVDKELVEYVAAFPLHMKIRHGRTKYVERALAKRVLPEAISARAKRGFRFPLAQWFGEDLYPFLVSIFSDSELARQGIMESAFITQLLDAHHRRRRDNHVKLWMLLNIEIWYRLSIQQITVDQLSAWVDTHLSGCHK